MLLILARLSSEMRCVTAAAKMFLQTSESLSAFWGCVLCCLYEGFLFPDCIALLTIDSRQNFNTALQRVCDDLSAL